MSEIKTEKYVEESRKGMQDPVLQKALADLQQRFGRGTAQAYKQLPEGPDLRLVAHEIRRHAMEASREMKETGGQGEKAIRSDCGEQDGLQRSRGSPFSGGYNVCSESLGHFQRTGLSEEAMPVSCFGTNVAVDK